MLHISLIIGRKGRFINSSRSYKMLYNSALWTGHIFRKYNTLVHRFRKDQQYPYARIKKVVSSGGIFKYVHFLFIHLITFASF